MIINKFPDRYSALPLQWTGSGPGVLRGNPVVRFGLGLLYGKYLTEISSLKTSWPHHCKCATEPGPSPGLGYKLAPFIKALD